MQATKTERRARNLKNRQTVLFFSQYSHSHHLHIYYLDIYRHSSIFSQHNSSISTWISPKHWFTLSRLSLTLSHLHIIRQKKWELGGWRKSSLKLIYLFHTEVSIEPSDSHFRAPERVKKLWKSLLSLLISVRVFLTTVSKSRRNPSFVIRLIHSIWEERKKLCIWKKLLFHDLSRMNVWALYNLCRRASVESIPNLCRYGIISVSWTVIFNY